MKHFIEETHYENGMTFQSFRRDNEWLEVLIAIPTTIALIVLAIMII
jgi:hypothetical protein